MSARTSPFQKLNPGENVQIVLVGKEGERGEGNSSKEVSVPAFVSWIRTQ